jgi:hypothetical protein
MVPLVDTPVSKHGNPEVLALGMTITCAGGMTELILDSDGRLPVRYIAHNNCKYKISQKSYNHQRKQGSFTIYIILITSSP